VVTPPPDSPPEAAPALASKLEAEAHYDDDAEARDAADALWGGSPEATLFLVRRMQVAANQRRAAGTVQRVYRGHLARRMRRLSLAEQAVGPSAGSSANGEQIRRLQRVWLHRAPPLRRQSQPLQPIRKAPVLAEVFRQQATRIHATNMMLEHVEPPAVSDPSTDVDPPAAVEPPAAFWPPVAAEPAAAPATREAEQDRDDLIRRAYSPNPNQRPGYATRGDDDRFFTGSCKVVGKAVVAASPTANKPNLNQKPRYLQSAPPRVKPAAAEPPPNKKRGGGRS